MTRIFCITVTIKHSCGHSNIQVVPYAFANTIKTNRAASVCPACWDKLYYKSGLVSYDKLFA